MKELAAAKQNLASSKALLEREAGSADALRRVFQDTVMVARKQAAYDSAPRGQRDLVAAIETSADPNSPEVDALRTRLYVGRHTRIDQKLALARARGLNIDEQRLEVDKALNRLRHPDGGFTRHPETGREETVGFFVSPYPEREQAIPLNDLRASHLRRFRQANQDLFRLPGHYMGGWHDPETQVVSLDVSVKTESAENARTLAEEHQQVAFYDAQTGGSVDVDTQSRARIMGLAQQEKRVDA